MKNVFLYFLFLFAYSSAAVAQGENNIWNFGHGKGVDFNSGTAVLVGSSLNTLEGSASMCGKDGALKFYSDGVNVFNRQHKQMPNGYGLLTDLSQTQGVAILPFVGDTNKFYLFVLHAVGAGTPHFLNYSVVDMSLESGLGDVVSTQKNIRIDSVLSEKMVVTRASGCNYWVIVHSGAVPDFHAFKITAAGIDTKPVITTTPHSGDGRFGIGEMKLSKDNRKMALSEWRSSGQLSHIELFSFDSSSGIFNNYLLLDSNYKYAAYGIEFSPDGQKLYAAFGEDEPRPPYSLIQYNLSTLPDIAMVRSTKTVLATAYNWGGMRLFRDKVYVIKSSNTATDITVINDPDKAGLSCNFKDSLIVFPTACFGLGNRVPETLPVLHRSRDTSLCNAMTFSGVPGYASYLWNDGFTGPSRSITPPATMWVYSSNGNCGAQVTDTIHLQQRLFGVELGDNKVLCRDDKTVLNCPITDAAYLWSNGASSQSIEVSKTDVYWVKVSQGDCTASDTIRVQLGDCTTCIAIPNSFTPNNDGRNDAFRAIMACPVLQYHLQIFNRYGQEIFQTTNPTQYWDGSFNGQPLDIGVYYYLVRATFDKPGGVEELYKGDLNLLR